MTIISKAARQQMVDVLVKRAFDQKLKDAQNEFNKSFMEVYVAYHGEANIKKMKALPDAYFNFKSTIGFRFTDPNAHVHTPVPVAREFSNNGDWYETELKKFMTLEQIELIKSRNVAYLKVVDDRYSFEHETNAAIQGARTFKKLWDVWPECHELLKDFEPSPTGNYLPALKTGHLNALLGIPSEAA